MTTIDPAADRHTPLRTEPDGYVDLRAHRIESSVSAEMYISSMRFERLINRNVDEGLYGWTIEKWHRVESEYKQWLILRRLYENERMPPTAAIDAFWHEHILDTRRYVADSAQIFGYYHHHFPYFGIRDAEDGLALEEAGENTFRRFREVFGAEPVEHP